MKSHNTSINNRAGHYRTKQLITEQLIPLQNTIGQYSTSLTNAHEGKDKTMAKKMTQKERVLMYIQKFGSISRRESFLDLGIVELSSRIGELEAMGYRFDRKTETSKNRFNESVSYTRYSLAEERTDA